MIFYWNDIFTGRSYQEVGNDIFTGRSYQEVGIGFILSHFVYINFY